jgi:hypothetical protein
VVCCEVCMMLSVFELHFLHSGILTVHRMQGIRLPYGTVIKSQKALKHHAPSCVLYAHHTCASIHALSEFWSLVVSLRWMVQ